MRNQDDEHNLRITRGGGKVWQSSRIRSVYRPRARLAQVFRQYLQYGYWKPFVMKKHGQPASLRHLVPSAWLVGLVLLALVAALGGSPWLLLGWVAVYGLAVLAMTLGVALGEAASFAALVRVPAVILAYHMGYGLGSLLGWWDALRHGHGRARFASLTR